MKSRALTSLEIDSIKAILKPRDRVLFILGLRTGFRISELLSLTVQDVADKDQVTVRRCNMKGKHSSRTVPLHTEAKEAIQAWLKSSNMRSSDHLFPFCRMTAHRILKDTLAQLGLQTAHISTHSMRKTFGMRVYELTGKDIVAAQQALGHKSLSSTTSYLNVDKDIVDAAILA